MQRKNLLTCLLVLVLLATTLLSPGMSTANDGVTGSVQPESGPPGTTFTFVASGFDSSERMGLWLVQPDGGTRQLGPEVQDNRRFADVDGTLVWTWTPPDLAPGGEWLMVARGEYTRRMVEIPFFVVSDQGNLPPSSWFVEPTRGGPGTTFTFVGRSTAFIPGEQVGSWFIQPNGAPLNVTQGMSVDPNGQIYRQWEAPPDVCGGQWIFRAVGISSGFNIDMDFIIEGPPCPEIVEEPITVEATPAAGPPGTTFTFVARGFEPNELVSNWLMSPNNREYDSDSAWRQADGNGVFTAQWQSPPDAPSGPWIFRMSGTQTDGFQDIPFQVLGTNPEGVPPATGPGSVSPESGLPGTEFRFTVGGFEGDEVVLYWLEDPNGMPFANEVPLEADAEGSVSWTWRSPEDAMEGQWQMVVRGRISPITLQIPCRILSVDANRLQRPAVEPEIGLPGTTFTFFADGFTSGEALDTWLSGPNGATYDLRDIAASREGEANWDWTAPPDIAVGEWSMIARGFQSRVQHIIPFRISPEADPEVNIPYGVTPESGPPGTTFTFFAEGFRGGERVSVWLTAPDGTTVRVGDPEVYEADELPADENGRLEVTWTSPPDAQRGTWNLTTRTARPDDIEDVIIYVIHFTIE
jgi:hypothetical protein